MSDQGGAYGSLKIDQHGAHLKHVTVSVTDEDTAPAPEGTVKLIAKVQAGVPRLFVRDVVGFESQADSAGLSINQSFRIRSPMSSRGTAERIIGYLTLAQAFWYVATDVYCDNTIADAAEVYVRIRDASDRTLLLEIATSQTTQALITNAELNLGALTDVEVSIATDHTLGVAAVDNVYFSTEQR